MRLHLLVTKLAERPCREHLGSDAEKPVGTTVHKDLYCIAWLARFEQAHHQSLSIGGRSVELAMKQGIYDQEIVLPARCLDHDGHGSFYGCIFLGFIHNRYALLSDDAVTSTRFRGDGNGKFRPAMQGISLAWASGSGSVGRGWFDTYKARLNSWVWRTAGETGPALRVAGKKPQQ
jgi:hypothetical protein